MARSKIKINTHPVAQSYAGDDERIIEFSSPGGGGLISIRLLHDDTSVRVEVYRCDDTVTVLPPTQRGDVTEERGARHGKK